MKLPRFSLRDLFWLLALVAMGLGWLTERTRFSAELLEYQLKLARAQSQTQITWINRRQGLCWIDAGLADGLTKNTTFDVLDETSPTDSKARIQVVRLTDPHLAECRILESDASKSISPGDRVFSVAWQPLK